jgi:hypothetical protein
MKAGAKDLSPSEAVPAFVAHGCHLDHLRVSSTIRHIKQKGNPHFMATDYLDHLTHSSHRSYSFRGPFQRGAEGLISAA